MSMSSVGKINKSGTSREPKIRGQKQSAIAHHDDRYRKLEAEHAKLLETQKQGMFTDGDDKRLEEIQKALAGYDSAMAQANTSPAIAASPEASTTSESDTVGQGTTTQDATQQQATRQDVHSHALAASGLRVRLCCHPMLTPVSLSTGLPLIALALVSMTPRFLPAETARLVTFPY
jgi:hypothetical protein